MGKYDWLLVLHLFGAFMLLSGAVAIQLLWFFGVRRTQPSEVVLFFNLGRIAELLINVGAVAALGFGIWLAHFVGYGFGQGWIIASIVLWVVSGALGARGGERYKRARVEAQRLAGAGDQATPELERLKRDPPAFVLTSLSGILAIVILVLMVWKPGAHL